MQDLNTKVYESISRQFEGPLLGAADEGFA